MLKCKINQFLFWFLLCNMLMGNNVSAGLDMTQYNEVWTSPSKNSGESMPCGGGDIGLNVWVENGDLLFYLSRSGAFDEINLFPKLGRVRVRLTPNPFSDESFFRQELKLKEGYVEISGKDCKIDVWVDVFRPVVHVETNSKQPVQAEVFYENWRIADRKWENPLEVRASRGYENAPEQYEAIVRKDSIDYEGDNIVWFHRNRDEATVFDLTVAQQKLETIKDLLYNPLKGLTFGGMMTGKNMKKTSVSSGAYADIPYRAWGIKSIKASTKHQVKVFLHIDNTSGNDEWRAGLKNMIDEEKKTEKQARKNTVQWWEQFWNRSYIAINQSNPASSSKPWQVGRNYQVFRYQLGCNAYGKYPTKFNGGLFTYDPVYVDKSYANITPDHRNWGGGTFTAQNQRLLYWPMLKSGDFDMMVPQFEFYRNILKTGELRTWHYFKHKGACWGEQLEQFGLTCAGDYGWDRHPGYTDGLDGNQWLEHEWDTPLEFCLMILDVHQFTGQDISKYIPLIESCLTFFFEHYQKEGYRNSVIPLDEKGKLIIYPGSGLETYKVTYNSSSTIAALQTVVNRFLELPEKYLNSEQRSLWERYFDMIPPIPFRTMEGYKTIAPAVVWSRISNVEIPQLYPVYPYGIYGVGKPDLDVAINTWKYGVDNSDQKSHISWHQDAIFCARMGLTDEAAAITIKKMEDSGRRFPTWWGPGHDWVPDHNWGGSGMIGLQEMLMQTDHNTIHMFPAWPKDWDVSFKLHAPYNTIIEGELKDGKIISLQTFPKHREKDIILHIN